MSKLEPTRTYSNPTATDILRRLLDERGVEWGDDGYTTTCTVWVSDGVTWHGLWRDDCIELIAHLTPEQAIAATLGSCNRSDNCTNSERTETCHDKNGFDPELGFECTVCGAMTDGYMLSPADTGHYKQFNFCPMCGRRIEQ